jgi:large subunit ribosomal protein L25
MLSLSAKIRKEVGKKVKTLRKKGILPAVLYGPKIKSESLAVDLKEFDKVYKEAGESTLIKLKIKNEKLKIEEYSVLIHDIKRDPLTGDPLHVDFYQPSPEKKIEADIPVILEGEAPAVKNFGGTLIKNISEIKVRSLPQNLPKEFRINIDSLKTLEDHILIKDLKVTEGVEILRESEEIVLSVAPPTKVEEELEKPIEEKVEEVEKVEKEKKEEEVSEEKEEEKKEEKPTETQTPKEEKKGK